MNFAKFRERERETQRREERECGIRAFRAPSGGSPGTPATRSISHWSRQVNTSHLFPAELPLFQEREETRNAYLERERVEGHETSSEHLGSGCKRALKDSSGLIKTACILEGFDLTAKTPPVDFVFVLFVCNREVGPSRGAGHGRNNPSAALGPPSSSSASPTASSSSAVSAPHLGFDSIQLQQQQQRQVSVA